MPIKNKSEHGFHSVRLRGVAPSARTAELLPHHDQWQSLYGLVDGVSYGWASVARSAPERSSRYLETKAVVSGRRREDEKTSDLGVLAANKPKKAKKAKKQTHVADEEGTMNSNGDTSWGWGAQGACRRLALTIAARWRIVH
jgi:hypothetical protein